MQNKFYSRRAWRKFQTQSNFKIFTPIHITGQNNDVLSQTIEKLINLAVGTNSIILRDVGIFRLSFFWLLFSTAGHDYEPAWFAKQEQQGIKTLPEFACYSSSILCVFPTLFPPVSMKTPVSCTFNTHNVSKYLWAILVGHVLAALINGYRCPIILHANSWLHWSWAHSPGQ